MEGEGREPAAESERDKEIERLGENIKYVRQERNSGEERQNKKTGCTIHEGREGRNVSRSGWNTSEEVLHTLPTKGFSVTLPHLT